MTYIIWVICKHILHDLLRFIEEYATSHTEDSVYIIGGRWRSGSSSSISAIAQFKDNEWTIAGYLTQARYGHGAITVNGMTMIIGGKEIPSRTYFTELWENQSFEIKHIGPGLESYYQLGLFLVEDGFCRKNDAK